MTGRHQIEAFIASHRDPATLPAGRFVATDGRKVRCVLCHRDGYGPVEYDPAKTYPTRPASVHRKLLEFIDGELRQVEGRPDNAPPPPKPVPWEAQFSRWQIMCMFDHEWPCSCGRRFLRFVDLWRHVGADRPAGWGRVGVHSPELICEVA